MDGHRHRFAREDTIDQEWHIVEPILDLGTRPVPYYQGTWGPGRSVIPAWHPVTLPRVATRDANRDLDPAVPERPDRRLALR